MKKILIAGGSGFIGTNFINYLSKFKIKIVNIDKISQVSTPEKFKKILNKKNYSFIKYNLNNPEKILKILKKKNLILLLILLQKVMLIDQLVILYILLKITFISQ